MKKRFFIYLIIIILASAGGYIYKIYGDIHKYSRTTDGRIQVEQHYKLDSYLRGEREGFRRTYWPNGNPREELTMVDDRPHGPAKTWWENGTRRSEDNYVDGRLHGDIKRYEPDGILVSEHTYRYGKLEGINKYYYADGTRRSVVTHKNNEPHGPATFYYEDGTLKEESTYAQGILHGPSRFYYPGGQLKQERTFFGGKIDGLQTWYYQDGTIWAKENKKLSKKDGVCEYYHPNGTLKQRGEYKDDKLHGKSVWYHPTGVKHSEEEYKEGKLHGWDSDYRWNGTPDDKSYYQDGRYDGLVETYYLSGEVRNRRHYQKGTAHGTNQVIAKDGDVLIEITMGNDRIGEVNTVNVDEALLEDQVQAWGKDSAFGLIAGALLAAGRFDLLEYAGNYIYADQEIRYEHYDDFVEKLTAGYWNLNIQDDPQTYLEILEKWKAAYPDSVLPDLVKINALINQAWSYRGSGYAKSVTKASFRRFREKLEEAERLVQRVLLRHPDNVDVYVRWIQIAMGLSHSDATVRSIFDKGQQVDPYYPNLYRQMATTLLPRWGGGKGELERFMRESTANLQPPRQDLVRAHILLHAISYIGFTEYLKKFNFTQQETLEYLKSYLSRYPHHNSAANTYGWLAHHYRDHERAKEAFRIIGDRPRLKTWDEAMTFLQAKAWAMSDQPDTDGADIHRAVSLGDRESLIAYIKSGGDINSKNSSGETLLHVALQNREWGLAGIILDKNPKLDIKDGDHYLPIHHAVRHTAPGTVKKLIDSGSPVDGYSLRSAAGQGSVEIAKLLLEKDPDIIHQKSNKDWTALHSACRAGQTDFLRYLAELDHVDWTAATNNGDQCLHLVVRKGATDAAAFLLDQNLADLKHRNNDGETPLEKARRHGFTEIVELLEAASKK